MTFRKSLLACAISAAVAAISVNAFACSTVIVGKSVSATGHIIVGHNEDNGGRIFNPQYYVPPAKHKAGEMITYEPTAAKIPQVPETLGFIGLRRSTPTAPPSPTVLSMTQASSSFPTPAPASTTTIRNLRTAASATASAV